MDWNLIREQLGASGLKEVAVVTVGEKPLRREQLESNYRGNRAKEKEGETAQRYHKRIPQKKER
jgi:hypothetical protein